MQCSFAIFPTAVVSTSTKKPNLIRRLRKRDWFARWEVAVLGGLAWALLCFIRYTTRFEVHGLEPLSEAWKSGRAVVMVGWHGRSLMLPFMYRGPGAYILSSTHRDGEIIARALARLGIQATRGSSSRRAVGGTLGLVRALRRGNDVAIVADGPRGPAGTAKSGVVDIALSSGAPLFPLVFSARPCIRMASWDRMMLPLPGARVVCVVAEPLETDSLATGKRDGDLSESLRLQLEERLSEACRRADGLVGRRQEST
jgi:lysophospholipid acyltransferase (LPLAT)-like uncharacterized protein